MTEMQTKELHFGMLFFDKHREKVECNVGDWINLSGMNGSSSITDILRAVEELANHSGPYTSSQRRAFKKCLKHPERLMVRKGSSKYLVKLDSTRLFDRFVAMDQVQAAVDCTEFNDDTMLFFVAVDKCSLKNFNDYIGDDQLRLLPPPPSLSQQTHSIDSGAPASSPSTVDPKTPSISSSSFSTVSATASTTTITTTSTSRKRLRSPSSLLRNSDTSKKQRIDVNDIEHIEHAPLKKTKKRNRQKKTKLKLSDHPNGDDVKPKKEEQEDENVFFKQGQQEVLWILVDATTRTEGKPVIFDRIRTCLQHVLSTVWNDAQSRTSHIGLYSFATKFRVEQTPIAFSSRAVQSMMQQFDAIKRTGSTGVPIHLAIAALLKHMNECSQSQRQFDCCKHRVLLFCGKHSRIGKLPELADTLIRQNIIFDVFEISSTYRHSELEKLTKSHFGRFWSIRNFDEDLEIMSKFLTCDVFLYAHHRVIGKESAVVIDSD